MNAPFAIPGTPLDPSDPINKGLVGWWPMWEGGGGKTLDISGKNNHGALTDGPLWDGGGVKFDGTDDHVSVNSTFGLGNTNVTIALWVNIPSLPAKGAFIKVGDISTGYAIGISNGGDTGFETSGSNLTALFEEKRWISTGVSPGTGWHHFALVIDGSGVPIVYKDGALVGSFPGSNSISPVTVTQIGGYTSGIPSNRFFSGNIRNTRIYNRALSQVEIQRLYVNPNAGLWTPDYARYYVAAAPASNDNSTRFIRIPGASMGMTRISGG